MRFDVTDPQRLTRRSDIAFWLHLLAAPLIVNGLLIGGLLDHDGRPPRILAVAATITLVALLVDRRALIVSSLAYVGAALLEMAHHGQAPGRADEAAIAAVALFLGLAVLGLSIGWKPLRRMVLRAAPPSLVSRLPPVR